MAVSSSGGNSIGPYTLTASPLDDYVSSAATTGRLTIGSSTGGKLEALNDSDFFAVDVIAGLNYQFNLTAVAGFTNPSNLDLSLFNSNLTALAGFGSVDKVVTYTTTATTTLYLGVDSSGGTGLGSYILAATPQDDYTVSTTTTGVVTPGTTTTGSLESLNDSDYFATSLLGGSNYTFTLSAVPGFSNAANLDLSLYNSNGTKLAGFGSVDKSVTYTPSASGTYYLDVTSSGGNGVGSYTITSGNVSIPVFRFFDSNTGTQFLTSSTNERDSVIATRPDLKYEGVGRNALARLGQPAERHGSVQVLRLDLWHPLFHVERRRTPDDRQYPS